jgi:hypothetical protein
MELTSSLSLTSIYKLARNLSICLLKQADNNINPEKVSYDL